MIDGEQADFYYEAITHILFLRDFLRETGMVNEMNNESWYYGIDWNGGDAIIDQQFSVVVDLLGNGDIRGDCGSFYADPGDFPEENTGVMVKVDTREPLTLDDFADSELWIQHEISGDPEAVAKWFHFLKWLRPDALLAQDQTRGNGHFYWFLNYENMSLHDEWSALISAWKVMEFYDHIANASEWSQLRRGLCEAHAPTDEITSIRGNGERCDSLQDRGMDPAAGIAGPLNDSGTTERREKESYQFAATA